MKNNEIAIVWVIGLTLIYMILCTVRTPNLIVQINKPEVKTKIVNTTLHEKLVGNENEALTRWLYKIENKLTTSFKSKKPKGQGFVYEFGVNSLKSETSLSINVLLPKESKKRLKEHENGHVEICTFVYNQAAKELMPLSKGLLMKTFLVEAFTFEKAQDLALKSANRWMVDEFDRLTNKKTNEISDHFDKLSKSSHQAPEILVKKAIEEVLSATRQESSVESALD